MEIKWYWPYGSEKGCWLEAISIVYDANINHKMEGCIQARYLGESDGNWHLCNYNGRNIDFINNKYLRPIHPHRWLAEKYEDGQKWQVIKDKRFKNIPHKIWVDIKLSDDFWFCPKFDITLDYRPSPEQSPELFKWYTENQNESK